MAAKTQPKTVTCRNCGEPFTPRRSTAQFCKASCRVAYNRKGYSGLTPEQVNDIFISEEACDEFMDFLVQARAEFDADVERIKQKLREATTPYDYEGALEAAERRFWRKRLTFEPAALRSRRRARV